MSESQSHSEALLTEIRHIGVVVRDVEDTAKYFAEKLGVSFTVRDMEHSGTLRGAPMKYKAKLAHAQLGAVTLELLQTVEGTADVGIEVTAQHRQQLMSNTIALVSFIIIRQIHHVINPFGPKIVQNIGFGHTDKRSYDHFTHRCNAGNP